MSKQRLPQHQQNDGGKSSAAAPAMEIDVPSRGSMSPSHPMSIRDQQLLKLKQQEEQLAFLEEQLRLARLGETPSRGETPRSRKKSSSSSRSSSLRRKTPGVGFCEDVYCYVNPRDYDEIVSSWYSVRQCFMNCPHHLPVLYFADPIFLLARFYRRMNWQFSKGSERI